MSTPVAAGTIVEGAIVWQENSLGQADVAASWTVALVPKVPARSQLEDAFHRVRTVPEHNVGGLSTQRVAEVRIVEDLELYFLHNRAPRMRVHHSIRDAPPASTSYSGPSLKMSRMPTTVSLRPRRRSVSSVKSDAPSQLVRCRSSSEGTADG